MGREKVRGVAVSRIGLLPVLASSLEHLDPESEDRPEAYPTFSGEKIRGAAVVACLVSSNCSEKNLF